MRRRNGADIAPVEPDRFTIPASFQRGKPKGGLLTVFANGWTEDKTRPVGAGFWIHDLAVNGRIVELHLQEGRLFRAFPRGWRVVPGSVAPDVQDYMAGSAKDAERLEEFWAKHRHSVSANAVSSQTLSVEELMQARRNGSSA